MILRFPIKERLSSQGGLVGVLRRCVQPLRRQAEVRAFHRIASIPCDGDRLARDVTPAQIAQVFLSDRIHEESREVEDEIARLGMSGEKPDAINPGDRRAIYYLVRHLRPRSVLEIGTHVGTSTVHIAAALRMVQKDDPEQMHQITTVDISDVNDQATSPWLKYGSLYSPAELAQRLGLDDRITFVTCKSLDYFASCSDQYDLIFLDGDHAARTVYQEIPRALVQLRREGVILLHDYFPALEPLWPGGTVIRGPWLATERLRSEGAEFTVIPLGALPWPTKLGSRTTSLAMLVGG
jgi:predicted O-methyltransferase YrrM